MTIKQTLKFGMWGLLAVLILAPPSQGSNVWAVHTEFRAKNRIGATGVARMTCYVELRSGDWHLRKFV